MDADLTPGWRRCPVIRDRGGVQPLPDPIRDDRGWRIQVGPDDDRTGRTYRLRPADVHGHPELAWYAEWTRWDLWAVVDKPAGNGTGVTPGDALACFPDDPEGHAAGVALLVAAGLPPVVPVTLPTPAVVAELVQLSDGEPILVHPHGKCIDASACCIHGPSAHPLAAAPLVWDADLHRMDRVCAHDQRHPDVDGVAADASLGRSDRSQHDCDGCCQPERTRS